VDAKKSTLLAHPFLNCVALGSILRPRPSADLIFSPQIERSGPMSSAEAPLIQLDYLSNRGRALAGG